MKNILHTSLKRIWEKLSGLGIDESQDFVSQRRIRTINIVIFLCLPIILLFWFLSYTTQHFLLADFYIIITLPLLVMLYCNYRKKEEAYRIALIIITAVITAIGGVLFNNGEEYYVLLIALLSILFYDLKKKVLYLSVLYAGIFLATEVVAFFVPPIEQAAIYIKISNGLIVLIILLYFLYDIKKMYLKFFDEILNKKTKLEESNVLLLRQAIDLELKNKDIEELKEKNEELSSIVYHQLRSPVVTFADLLSQYLESSTYSQEEFVEATKAIQNKVADTLNVIDNLLAWNRKGADGITPKVLKCEVKSITQKALTQVQSLIERKNLKISHVTDDSVFAFADADHMLIILINVLTNAIKFSPVDGYIRIESIDVKNKCKVLINNYGKEIDKEQAKVIFSSKQIISSKGTMNETGTGLGLKICKNLVERNNGSISIFSDERIGTNILIELPARA